MYTFDFHVSASCLIQICDPYAACSEGDLVPTTRGRRATPISGYHGPTVLGLAVTSTTLANTPPEVTSPPTADMDEDKVLNFLLTATDVDGDAVVFVLDQTEVYPGLVDVQPSGMLTFTPEANYAGTAVIFFKVILNTHVYLLIFLVYS